MGTIYFASPHGNRNQEFVCNCTFHPRKRENPLYDEGEPDDLEQKPKKPCGALACPCSGFIVVALVALVSLVLAILLLAGSVQPKEGKPEGFLIVRSFYK